MSSTPIKVQFFLAYGVLGSLSPIAALVLADKGFTDWQFGVTLALASVGLLVSPAFMTWLADREVDTRHILRFVFATSAAALAAVYYLDNVWPITICWAIYSIVYVPTLPLLDGYYFNHERAHGAGAAGADGGYQFVRVWGTIGFLVPSIAVYFIIDATGRTQEVLWCAVAWCALSFAGTYALQRSTVAGGGRQKAPTLRALRVLASPAALPFCIGLLFVHLAATAYYPVFSAFLRESVGVPDKWVALLMSLGVAIEIGYLFGLGPLRRWLRIRGLVLFGLSTMALRLAALAMFPNIATALLIQVLHGLEILAMFVIPVIYLDRVAGDGFRNSIQGAFTVAVTVPTRFAGPLLAGWIRGEHGEGAVLYTSAALVATGFVILLFFFKPLPPPQHPD